MAPSESRPASQKCMTRSDLRDLAFALCETYGPERAKQILLQRLDEDTDLKEALAEFYWLEVADTKSREA